MAQGLANAAIANAKNAYALYEKIFNSPDPAELERAMRTWGADVRPIAAAGSVSSVVKGDLVVVLEAMKMEQPLQAHKDGVIGAIDAAPGTTVSAGHQLLTIS